MSKRESLRKEAERRGVSHGTIFRERKSEDLINKTGEDLYIVYAWRWSGDDMHAKIGHTLMSKLESRMVATYHPTDDPVLIGIMKCDNLKDSKLVEKAILNNLLQRTRPDRGNRQRNPKVDASRKRERNFVIRILASEHVS